MEEFENARVNVGVSVIVRITLKDGTYREVKKKFVSIDRAQSSFMNLLQTRISVTDQWRMAEERQPRSKRYCVSCQI